MREPNSNYVRDAWTTVLVAMRVRGINRGNLADAMGLHRNTVGIYLQDPESMGGMTVTAFLDMLRTLGINPRTLEHGRDS